MNNQPNAFFFQTQEIPDNSLLFDELKNQQLFFSYFQVHQDYYLFFYEQKSIDIGRIEPLIHILDELDRKQRKIRSLRGFFLYVLEIMENGQDYQILKTNLQPSFWRKLKTILRQNKKSVLLEFLFGKDEDDKSHSIGSILHLEDQIQILQNQVNSLQARILDLETKREGQNCLSGTPDARKIIQQGDSSLKDKKGSYLRENDSQTDDSSRFKKPKDISEQELIEILEKGFRLRQEGEISLIKYYYEEKGKNTLFEDKKYSLKYGDLRNTELYKKLNPNLK